MVNEKQRFANDVARRAHAVFRQEGWQLGSLRREPTIHGPSVDD